MAPEEPMTYDFVSSNDYPGEHLYMIVSVYGNIDACECLIEAWDNLFGAWDGYFEDWDGYFKIWEGEFEAWGDLRS